MTSEQSEPELGNEAMQVNVQTELTWIVLLFALGAALVGLLPEVGKGPKPYQYLIDLLYAGLAIGLGVIVGGFFRVAEVTYRWRRQNILKGIPGFERVWWESWVYHEKGGLRKDRIRLMQASVMVLPILLLLTKLGLGS